VPGSVQWVNVAVALGAFAVGFATMRSDSFDPTPFVEPFASAVFVAAEPPPVEQLAYEYDVAW
jgi:hypothetical protein